jgi:hypothetical protein
MQQILEVLDLLAGIGGEQRTEVDAALALAGAAAVGALPRPLEAVGNGDVVLLLVASGVEEITSILEGAPAGDSDLLVQLRVARQISLGLDIRQIGGTVRVAALIVAGRGSAREHPCH